MSAVVRFFFRVPSARTTAWSILQWWELRRPVYNLTVGGAGLVTLSAFLLVAGWPPSLAAAAFLGAGIMAYGIMANLCYCLGPMADILVHRRFGPAYDAVGPALFRYGFVFSIGLTLFPIPLLVLSRIARVLASLW